MPVPGPLLFLQPPEPPLSLVILNAVGNTLDRIGDRQKGFTYYEKALQVDSSFIKTYLDFGCSLNNAGRYNKAEKIWKLGLIRKPLTYFDRSSHLLNLAYSYAQLDLDQIIAQFCVTLSPL